MKSILALCAAAVFAFSATAAEIIAEGATPQVLGDGNSFTEGPAADREGNVFFTDSVLECGRFLRRSGFISNVPSNPPPR